MESTFEKRYKVAIIGSTGKVGEAIVNYLYENTDWELMLFSSTYRSEKNDNGKHLIPIDYSDCNSLTNKFRSLHPEIIINTAAMTNVDGCETDRNGAWLVNVDFVDCIAKVAYELNSKLIHISTDYIFDGNNGPYREFDQPNPISWYGYTKFIGETKTEMDGLNSCILRTNVVYGNSTYGKSDFVKWVINELRNNRKIKIVSDQYSNPTITDDIAIAVYKVIKLDKKGIYNIGGSDYCDRYSFAKKIAKSFELDCSLIHTIQTKELNQPAERPLKSGLVIDKSIQELDIKFSSIDDGLMLLKTKYGYKK